MSPIRLVAVGLVALGLAAVIVRTFPIGDPDRKTNEGPQRSIQPSGPGVNEASDLPTTAQLGTDQPSPQAPVGEPSTTTTSFLPPDVAHSRPAIDLAATPPDGQDPSHVARWWAATHAAHVGAEPAADLASRLADLSTPSLVDALAALPPTANYHEPTPIVGVSTVELGHDDTAHRRVRATVETPIALVVYDIGLAETPGGRWRVNEVATL